MMIPEKVKVDLKKGSKKEDLKNSESVELAEPITIKTFIDNKDIYITQGMGDYQHLIFDFIDNEGRKYTDLSHGEQTIYGQLIQMYFYSKSEDDFLFLFDEPEISLHPKWQIDYLNEVINLLKKTNKQYHFIFTSHSPFLLSDLPKENVIFLKEGKQVDVNINPFGANIHTRLLLKPKENRSENCL